MLILPGVEPAYCRRLRRQYEALGFPGVYLFDCDEATQMKWADFLRPWADAEGHTHPSREAVAECSGGGVEPKYVGCHEPPAAVLPRVRESDTVEWYDDLVATRHADVLIGHPGGK